MSETTQRLLEAAGEVFAEKGFRSATIREICDRAKTNVAAVNYHYRDKEGLYLQVLEYWTRIGEEKFPPDLGLGPNPTPEEQLRAFIRSFLFRIFDKGRPAWLSRLMAHEMADPTAALDRLIDEVYRPLLDRLAEIVRSLLGAAARDDQVRLYCRSITGQCLYYYHARPVIQKMTPEFKYEQADLERLADHITRFSLAALRQLS
jgi:AcrR family transcriptional regulator